MPVCLFDWFFFKFICDNEEMLVGIATTQFKNLKSDFLLAPDKGHNDFYSYILIEILGLLWQICQLFKRYLRKLSCHKTLLMGFQSFQDQSSTRHLL